MDNNQLIQEESINVKQILRKILSNWPWLLMSVIIALIIGFLWSKTMVQTYESYATLLINKNDKENALSDFLFSQGAKPNVSNEVGILKSIETKKNALSYIQTGISFYHISKFKSTDLYSNPPFMLMVDSLHYQPLGVLISVQKIGDNKLQISCEADQAFFKILKNSEKSQAGPFNIDTIVNCGEWLITENVAFKIDSVKQNEDNHYAFSMNSIATQVSFYESLEIEMDKESSLVGLRLKSGDPQKSQDLLNALIKAYLNRDILKKLEERTVQIDFIDQLIGEIADSLSYYENQLAEFQTENLSIGIDAKSTDLYGKYSELQSKLSQLSLQQRYYKYVAKLLAEDKTLGDLISPTTLGINEPIINDLVVQLIELYNQKSEITFNTRKDNPYVGVIDEKIQNLKESLTKNIQNNLDALELARDEHELQLSKLEKKLSGLPIKSKQLNAYERKFTVIDELYTFLLKKRSEARIEKAATRPLNEVIQWASTLTTISGGRNTVQILLIAFILGLLLPIGFIQLKSSFLNKLEEEGQITRITDIPIVGQVIHMKAKNKDAFIDPNSTASESFRSIRTNLRFFHNNNGSKVFLVTSSKQGEGKSFISHNIAKAFDYNNQKTILLNFDLRKNTNTNGGLSSYLSNQCSLEEILMKNQDGYDEILSGPMPPNASELMNSEKVKELFQTLRSQYDVIIVDSPPLVPISDAVVLGMHSDIQLFITRVNYTSIELFKQIINRPSFKSFSKPLILVNDISAKNSYYGYYYKNGNY
jgi:tyrosine-protein kinase Etk/Wzc